MKNRALIMFAFGAALAGACGKHPLAGKGNGGSPDASGTAGVSGASGSSGAPSTTGVAGTNSAPGTAGSIGAPGAAGSIGAPGAAGSIGAPGAAGSIGAPGAGTAGTSSAAGTPGSAGVSGSAYVPTIPITHDDQPFTNPPNVLGAWTGYVENYMFPSGSDSIVLQFGKDAQGLSTLRVILGEGVPPALPTDPTKKWPPSLDLQLGSSSSALEGFVYPAHEVRWQGQRLRFKLAMAEPWAPWCGLQKSYALSESLPPNDYNCVPGNGGSSSDTECVAQDRGKNTVVPCDQFSMCLGGRFCTCNATGCGPTVEHDRAYDITFDGGFLAAGSGYIDDGLRNVHFMALSD